MRKHDLQKPNCETLQKVYLLLAAPLPPAQARPAAAPPPQHDHPPQRLQTLHHHNPQTHPKRSLPLLCLPQMLHYVCQPTYDGIQSQ